jgi:tetratricopeptide (TPR) repeat protein
LVAGRINLEVGNPEEALELLNRYDPYDSNKSWQYYYALGKAYYLVGDDLSEAEELLSKAVSMGGNSKELFFARAIVNYELGDLSKAVNDAFKARDLDRLDFTVNLYLSELLYQDGQFSLALVYLNISSILAQSESEFATVYFWRAFTFEELGLYDQSISDWRKLMELPLENVPDEWEIIAAEKLIPTATPTPTSTFTPTYTPTITPSATLTPLVTETPTPSPTP